MSSEQHEVVSIYPFTDETREELLSKAGECVFNWSTKDGWPVGVIHAFVWRDGRGWITCGAHRHRVAAIRRDPRCSVVVSGVAAPNGLTVADKIERLAGRELQLEQEIQGYREQVLELSDQYGRTAMMQIHESKVEELMAIDQKLAEFKIARTRLELGTADDTAVSLRIPIITRSSALSCSMRAFCLSEFF